MSWWRQYIYYPIKLLHSCLDCWSTNSFPWNMSSTMLFLLCTSNLWVYSAIWPGEQDSTKFQGPLEFTRSKYSNIENTRICTTVLLKTRSTFWSLTFQIRWVSKCRVSRHYKSSEVVKLIPLRYNLKFSQKVKIHSAQCSTVFSVLPLIVCYILLHKHCDSMRWQSPSWRPRICLFTVCYSVSTLPWIIEKFTATF